MIGHYLAIHASTTFEYAGRFLRDRGIQITLPDQLAYGAIIGVAWLEGVIESACSLAVGQRRWFVGPYGWRLEDIVPVPAVKCAGGEGLWELPEKVLADVRNRYRWARRQANRG